MHQPDSTHIFEDILYHLDLRSLKNLRQASPAWRKVMENNTSKAYKKHEETLREKNHYRGKFEEAANFKRKFDVLCDFLSIPLMKWHCDVQIASFTRTPHYTYWFFDASAFGIALKQGRKGRREEFFSAKTLDVRRWEREFLAAATAKEKYRALGEYLGVSDEECFRASGDIIFHEESSDEFTYSMYGRQGSGHAIAVKQIKTTGKFLACSEYLEGRHIHRLLRKDESRIIPIVVAAWKITGWLDRVLNVVISREQHFSRRLGAFFLPKAVWSSGYNQRL